MRDDTLLEFLKNLGAKQPVPGGGAVAALNGAIAAAQLRMICEYTKDEHITGKITFLDQKIQTFLDLAEADSEAFAVVGEAYKSKDKEKITSALTAALKPSLEVIVGCEELLSLCEEDYLKFNDKLKADLITALANLKASVRSAMAMINTNTEALEDTPADTKENLPDGREVLARVDKLYEKIGV